VSDATIDSVKDWVRVESQPFFGTKSLYYTTDAIDARPIVQTKVEYEPCLDVSRTSQAPY
jgi:hypothetical protein